MAEEFGETHTMSVGVMEHEETGDRKVGLSYVGSDGKEHRLVLFPDDARKIARALMTMADTVDSGDLPPTGGVLQ